MKNLFVIFAVFSLAFFYACQENSITDPAINDTGMEHSTPMENTLDKDQLQNGIKLEGILADPIHRLNSYAEIGGVVEYRIENIGTVTKPPYSGVKVSLRVRAELKHDCPHSNGLWVVNERSETVLYTSPGMQITQPFQKSFKVSNTCCGKVRLVMVFSLSGKYLTLESMGLLKVNSSLIEPIGDPISE